ncbi:MAG: HAD family phosphatase [Chloroflexota bacterium]
MSSKLKRTESDLSEIQPSTHLSTKFKAIIFDFGGVLMRTADPVGRRDWEQRLSLAPGDLERLVHGSQLWLNAQQGLISADEYWQGTARRLRISDEDLTVLRSDYFRDDHLDLKLVELIGKLRNVGYKIGLLSNDALTLEQKLRVDLGIYDAFDAVVISAAIGVMKPDPRPYETIVLALGVISAECIFIDDNLANVEGARACGMTAIHFHADMDLASELGRLLKP